MQKVMTNISVGQMTIADKDNIELPVVNGKAELVIGEQYDVRIPVLNKSTEGFPAQEIPVHPIDVDPFVLGCYKTYFSTSRGATFNPDEVKEDNPDYGVYPAPDNTRVFFYKKTSTPAEYEGEIKVRITVNNLGTWLTCQHLVSNNNPDYILGDTKSTDNSTSIQY